VTQDEFPEWLWQKMKTADSIQLQDVRTGGNLSTVEEKDLNPDMYLQLKLSTLRAIMTKTIFKPRNFIKEKSVQIVESWRHRHESQESLMTTQDNDKLGLLIHIRRTDKKEDLGKHWEHIDFHSSAHMGLYVQEIEAALHRSFNHCLVMSDDPHMYKQALKELTPFFAKGNETKTLYSDSLCHFLGSNNFNYSGHESLGAPARHNLYVSR
jgi:hypothetical protein